MKILSFNINGIESSFKKNLTELLLKIDADIICLGEIKLSSKYSIDKYFDKFDKYNIYMNECKIKSGYAGTCILSKIKPINIMYGLNYSTNKNDDKEGRCITLEFKNFYLIFTYVPNSGENLQFKEKRLIWDKFFHSYVSNLLNNKEIIITGDLNVARFKNDVFDGLKNKKRPLSAGYTTYERFNFETLLNACNLVDVWDKLHKNKIKEGYSFWSYRIPKSRYHNLGWRLDYFVVSYNLVDKIIFMKNLQNIEISDHSPQLIQIDI